MKPFHVAVNLSAQQLTAPGVVDLVREQLVRAGAQPANIMLEVTESAVMSDVDAATATLDRLRDMGIPIVVDDFGTGYSSLTYVKRFPITGLKIDRSFVGGLGVDDDDAAIVASVVSLAAAVRIDCIAEGVETEQQLAALQELNCEYAQGFLWAPALDADELEDWVRDHNPTALRQGQDAKSRRSRPTRSPASVAGQPPSAAVCTRIASLHAQGASLSTIAAALNAEGLLTTEGRRWHPRSVARALTGPRRRQD